MVKSDTNYIKTKAIELALLELIKKQNLITESDYEKIKLKIEQEFTKNNKLNNLENYTYAV